MRSRLAHARGDLTWLLVGAGAVRLLLFSGFVLGDDSAYAGFASRLLARGYPPVHGIDVFATRPILIALIAASIKAFGWSERAVTLPFFICSLLGIGSCYCIGALLHSRRAGIIGAAVLALLPLDLVYATTLTNDIVGTAFVGCGAATALWGAATWSERRRRALVFCVFGGALVGLSAGVKLSFVSQGVPIALIVAWAAWRRAPALVPGLAVAGGWLAAQAVIAIFFRATSGDWLANYRVEFAFNQAFLLEPYARSRTAALLSYPRWALLTQPVGPVNETFFPYGLFFPIALACLGLGLIKRTRGVTLLAVWAIAIFAILEFAPAQMVPHYVPIHRLPRFLHAVVLPGAALIGAVLADASLYSVRAAVLSLAILATYAVSCVDGSLAAWKRHRDAMLDLRASAEMALAFPGRVIGDNEMLDYLRFRDGYRHPDRFVEIRPERTDVTESALVLLGGGRRVDLDPAYVVSYIPRVVPHSWMKLADMPGLPSPWRTVRGSIYVAGGDVGHAESTANACPPGRQWTLRDVVDIGNPGSEAAHEYVVDNETWRGQRTMFDTSHDSVTDDGRAFRGAQRFVISGLLERSDACVVVRVDAGVRHQVSRWFVDGTAAATTDTGTLAADGWWRTKTFLVPARFIAHSRAEMRERFSSSDLDINGFRVDVFQEESR